MQIYYLNLQKAFCFIASQARGPYQAILVVGKS